VAILGLSLATYLTVYVALLAAYIGTVLHLARTASKVDGSEHDPGQFKGAVVGALS